MTIRDSTATIRDSTVLTYPHTCCVLASKRKPRWFCYCKLNSLGYQQFLSAYSKYLNTPPVCLFIVARCLKSKSYCHDVCCFKNGELNVLRDSMYRLLSFMHVDKLPTSIGALMTRLSYYRIESVVCFGIPLTHAWSRVDFVRLWM